MEISDMMISNTEICHLGTKIKQGYYSVKKTVLPSCHASA